MRAPAVDLFLRNLSFEFSRDGVLGVPSGLVGLAGPHPDERAIWFMHEVEHLTQLTHPLGAILTALSLRAIDLRNEAVVALNEWDFDDTSLAKVIDACGRHREQVLIVRVLSDWMQPLLEGLALVAEMDLDHTSGEILRAPAAATLFAEMPQLMHRMLATERGRDVWAGIMSSDPGLWAELYSALEQQVRISRDIRRESDLIDEVFWGAGDADGTWPYFIGYLYARQLMQTWSPLTADNSPERLHDRVTKAVCSVIPMTVLPICSGIGWEENVAPVVLAESLGLLSRRIREFEAKDVERIGRGLWRIGPDNRLQTLLAADEASQTAGIDPVLLFLISEELEHIFGMTEATEEHHKTALALHDLEWGKFAVPSMQREVAGVALAIDESGATLLLIDRQADRSAIGTTAVTYFEVDERQLRELAASDAFDVDSLPRIDLAQPPPYRAPGQSQWRLLLGTYLHFWPAGVRADLPLKVVRVLVTRGKRGIYDANATDDDIRACGTRETINRHWAPLIARATDVRQPAPGDVVERIVDIVGSSSPDATRAMSVLAGYAPLHAESQVRIRHLLAEIVFGSAVDVDAIHTRRFGILADALSHDDVAVLRRAMRNGLLLSRTCAVPRPDEKDRAAVARIRVAATRLLGVPLVQWREEDRTLVLDLSRTTL